MTLDELLALLPDNTTGQISPADLRTIVTDLHQLASLITQVFPYRWDTSIPPGSAGQITMDNPWSMATTAVMLSKTTDDGVTLGFTLIDSMMTSRIQVMTGTSKFVANITGPSVDMGVYREIPVAPISIDGVPPGNNSPVSVVFAAVNS